jgi:hypothetical protein
MTKEELVSFLDAPHPIASKPDHANAESKLLEYINDVDITKAYQDRGSRNQWSY